MSLQSLRAFKLPVDEMGGGHGSDGFEIVGYHDSTVTQRKSSSRVTLKLTVKLTVLTRLAVLIEKTSSKLCRKAADGAEIMRINKLLTEAWRECPAPKLRQTLCTTHSPQVNQTDLKTLIKKNQQS